MSFEFGSAPGDMLDGCQGRDALPQAVHFRTKLFVQRRRAPLAQVALYDQQRGARRGGQQHHGELEIIAHMVNHLRPEGLQQLSALAGQVRHRHRASQQQLPPFLLAPLGAQVQQFLQRAGVVVGPALQRQADLSQALVGPAGDAHHRLPQRRRGGPGQGRGEAGGGRLPLADFVQDGSQWCFRGNGHTGSLFSPAIINPSSASDTSPGRTSPMISPRCSTMIRSLSDRISSSSVEMYRMPAPRARCSSRRPSTNSVAPTSSPRVGCAARISTGARDSSRARTTFCWLPPESVRALTSGPATRMSNSLMRSSALSRMAAQRSSPSLTNGALENSLATRFSLTVKSSTRPTRCRSCGMWATFKSTMSLASRPARLRPLILISPARTGRSPAMASTSSPWPLPSTPATPSTSPQRTSKLTPRSAIWPWLPITSRPCTLSTISPGLAAALSSRKSTSRPTIIRARVALSVLAVASVSTTQPSRSTVTR